MSSYLAQVLQESGELSVRKIQCPQGRGNFSSNQVANGSKLFKDIEKAMQKTIKQHAGNKGGIFTSYKIDKIEQIGSQSLMDRFNSYRQAVEIQRRLNSSANVRMLFHGTTRLNRILTEGFDKSEANPDGMFGGGFYFTDVSSKANQYVIAGKPCPNHNNISCYMCPRKMLLCRVILGNSLKLDKALHLDTISKSYHSVTGVPSPHGLKHKEYVVYKSQQFFIASPRVRIKEIPTQYEKRMKAVLTLADTEFCIVNFKNLFDFADLFYLGVIVIYPEYVITYRIQR